MADRRTLIALITVQVLFGLLPVSTKIAFRYLDPFPLAAIRIVGGAVALIAMSRWLIRGVPVPMNEAPRIGLFAFLGVIINQGLFILGLERTTAIHATLIITTIPVFTYLIAVLMRREVFGPRRALGIAVALSGIAYLLGLSDLAASSRTLVGDVMVLLNSLSYASFLVLSKPFAERYDPTSLTLSLFLVASAFFLPLGLLMGLLPQASAMPWQGWAVMAFIIAGPTVGAYVINNTALQRVPASTVAVFVFLQPIVATSTAIVFLGERLTLRLVPAAALVFLGVWTVAVRTPVRGRASEPALPESPAP